MNRGIEPPRLIGKAEGAHHFQLEDLLRLQREVVHRGANATARCDLLDERGLVRLQVVEDLPDFLRLHPTLVVVQHDVVRLVDHVEAVDVPLAQVEVLAQDGQERLEVVVLPRLDPHRVREGRRAGHLRAQIGRHLPQLLPVE